MCWNRVNYFPKNCFYCCFWLLIIGKVNDLFEKSNSGFPLFSVGAYLDGKENLRNIFTNPENNGEYFDVVCRPYLELVFVFFFRFMYGRMM